MLSLPSGIHGPRGENSLHLDWSPPEILYHLSPATFNSLPLPLACIILMCLSMDFFRLILFGITRASHTCKFMSFANFSYFFNLFLVSLSPFLLGCNDLNTNSFLIVPQFCETLNFFLQSIFSVVHIE